MLKNIIDENLSPSINKPKLLDQLRAIIPTKHYSLRTEESYIQWIKRFILFHNKRHANEMSEVEINQFLSHLAVKKNGNSSPQSRRGRKENEYFSFC